MKFNELYESILNEDDSDDSVALLRPVLKDIKKSFFAKDKWSIEDNEDQIVLSKSIDNRSWFVVIEFDWPASQGKLNITITYDTEKYGYGGEEIIEPAIKLNKVIDIIHRYLVEHDYPGKL